MDALENLLAHLRVQQVGQPKDFDFVELDDFTVYRPPDVRLHHDMCTLSRLQVLGTDKLLFDGTLAVNGHRHFVQGVPFSTLTIDYDDDVRFDTRKRACIQSFRGQRANVWYRLGTPADEYRRYYNPFNWVATFTALFLEYLEQQGCKVVTLADFRSRFLDWLQASHGSLPEITAWLAQCKLKDFRSSVIANFDYLNKECHSLGLVPVRLWVEVNPADLRAIPKQVNDELKTVVTPFVYDMFKDMYFATHLNQKTASNGLLSEIATRKRSMALTPLNSRPTTLPTVTDVVTVEGRFVIRPGDVVQIPQDPNSTWRGLDAWFVYVQDVRGEHMDVIWLYHSSHTTLDELAYYPFQNELFMSDNCRCGQDAEPIYQVIRKVDVRWFPTDPNSVSQTEFFVRQKYRSVLEDFVTLRSSDFNCECHLDNDIAQWETCCATYSIGDYVLFREGVSDDHALVPAQVIAFDRVERKLCLESLRCALGHAIRPNELIETGNICAVSPTAIDRKCIIARYCSRNAVNFPFDRDGAGDHYYIIDEATKVVPGSYTPSIAPMRGLGMFCGGGNFDRGLAECGAVEFKHALDWAEHALHSYRANVDDPTTVSYFLGSVNDYLAQAMKASCKAGIATIGEVDLISAGSPCPGFSPMQPDKQSQKASQMASLVASVVSYVDFYSPRYLVLENVVSMTNTLHFAKEQNVFKQIVAALVALGYQTQQFLMDAWSYGSSQQRSRVFIIASAPGLPPLEAPPHTHAHAKQVQKKGLGRASNGEMIGARRDDWTPFAHVSTTASTAHLPNIGDATVGLCPDFPDHRTTTEETAMSRDLLAQIPIRPYEMSLQKAVHRGLITSGSAYEWVKSYDPKSIRGRPDGKSYQRVAPDGWQKWYHGTLGAAACAHCPKEVRIAQGFRPHEVILGSPGQQMKIVGNSVDRWVAFALGLQLRKSWDARPRDEDEASGRGMQSMRTSQRAGAMQIEPSPEQLQAIGHEVDEVRAGGFKAIRRRLLTVEAASTESGASSRRTSLPVDLDDKESTPCATSYEAKSTSTTPSRRTMEGATEAHGLLTPIQREGSDMESAIMID
ncbi:hypothetical protein LTR95_017359 [Oleoguttula sp. CCFEE 5521]